MKIIKLCFSAWLCCAALIIPSLLMAANDNSDAIQKRYIIIQNDLPMPIFPVVQVPDNNCQSGSTSLRRIIVNAASKGSGIPSGQSVKVFMPDKCWYNAGRLYIFSVDLLAFEQKLDPAEKTVPDGFAPNTPLCIDPNVTSANNNSSNDACYTSSAKASYPLDAPAQLVEYTYDSFDPETGLPSPNPDTGVLMTDIDLSYVDQLYLPIAVTLDDQGASRFMGTILPYDKFNNRVKKFIAATKWSPFAAFSPANWNNNAFNTLVKQSYNIPACYNLFSLVNAKAPSELYTPAVTKNPSCSAWSACSNLAGDCCPSSSGVFLACCGTLNFMIDNTTLVNNKVFNPFLSSLVERWMKWVTPGQDPCNAKNINDIKQWPSHSPQFDKKEFCYAFKNTVQFTWDTFKNTAKECEAGVDETQCILQHIIGYNSKVLSGKIPESVQAVLRGVPYIEKGQGPQYQYDKWLLFWAPYDSIFNLNPYSRLIHNDKDGVDAVAYSFSIDDKYGNYREKATGFIVDAGGSSKLLNKESYDPYEQYFVGWADGWSRAIVCDRDVEINKLPSNARIFMWKDGKKTPYCDVTVYADDTHFVKFRIVEDTYTVTDSYTDVSGHTVHGIKNIDDKYCDTNSSPELKQVCHSSNFSAIQTGDIAYVSLSANEKPNVNLSLPPAPLIPPPGSATDCTGRLDDQGNPIPCCQTKAQPEQFCPAPYEKACPACTGGNCECLMPSAGK